jgi:hypothetical protein
VNEKNSAELIATFPEMFHDLDPRSPMALFSFECEDGWFGLLKDCFEKLREISKEKNFPITCFQVKEKYGTLRIYLNGYECCSDEAIEKAVAKSEVTCELCSEVAELRKRGSWYLTRCEECWRKDCERYPQDIK